MTINSGASAGDQIVLLSGGPVMTVKTEEYGGKVVTAQWFSGKKLESGVFAYGSFRAATDDDRK